MSVPYLCGGIFLTLLLKVARTGPSKKQIRQGVPFATSNKATLAGLIKIVNPNFKIPSGRGFDTFTTGYRTCGKDSYTDLPPKPTDPLAVEFDTLVSTNYPEALERVNDFTDSFLSYETQANMDWLGRFLLEYIEKDTQSDGDSFYADVSGKSQTKAELLAQPEISLQPLLLGVWHYIIMNRFDNKSGEDTFREWNMQSEIDRTIWNLTANLGSKYRNTKIKVLTPYDMEEAAESYEAPVEEIPPEIIDRFTEKTAVVQPTRQIINNWYCSPGGTQIGEVHGDVIIGGKK